MAIQLLTLLCDSAGIMAIVVNAWAKSKPARL